MNEATNYIESHIEKGNITKLKFGQVYIAYGNYISITDLYSAITVSNKYELLEYIPYTGGNSSHLIFRVREDWSRLTNEDRTFRGNI